MKKQYLFLAAAALTLGMASCSSDDKLGESPQSPAAQTAADAGVAFDVYIQKGITRGGVPGSVTTADLKDDAKALGQAGFGVFGYYTDNNEYDQRSTPNFFYNQQVTWVTDKWAYDPVKYWPNEYGTNATSDDQDKVTYFAYAPWVEVIPTNGKLKDVSNGEETWGITGMTKNSAQGDPIIKYIASFNANKSVDLCWGVADNNDGQWPIIAGGPAQSIANGTPWIDVERPATTDQKVKFTFKHATAQMKMTIDAIFDEIRPGATPNEITKKTRIWVRSVTLKGIAMKGALNLNNENAYNPYWLDYGGQNELVSEDVIVLDGRKDGKEGVAGSVATNEKVLGLNPAIVQDGVYEIATPADGKDVYTKDEAIKVMGKKKDNSTEDRPGVTQATRDLFADNDNYANTGTSGSIFHVIPTGDDFEIEIVYDVETVDKNLAQNLSDGQTKGSSIENRISKKISFGSASKLQAGHSYTLALHLGMNSVKFDADVTEWVEEPATDVDLPLNAPILANNGTAFIDYNAASFDFALFGMEAGEPVLAATYDDQKQNSATGAVANDPGWTATNNPVWANGYALEQLTVGTNPTTSNRQQSVTWTGGQSAQQVKVTFTQKAHPIGLGITAPTAGATTITLTSTAATTFGWWCKGLADDCASLAAADYVTTDAMAQKVINDEANGIVVYINGTRLTQAAAASTAGTFTFADGAGTITLNANNALVAGSIITVYLKTGDAAVEVAQATVAAAP